MYTKLMTFVSIGFAVAFAIPAIGLAQEPDSLPEEPEKNAQASLQKDMQGVWLLAGKPGAEIEPQPGARIKFFGHGYWTITESDPKTGEVIFHHGGTYSLEGDKYTERITFANDSTKQMIGSEFKYAITVKDGRFTQIGDGNPFTEIWIRPAE